jgi:predicted DNA-binding mobile mystery protein A
VQFARRLRLTPQAVIGLERSEASGTIQLDTLRRAAEALDCTLVYAIVPNESLASMVDKRARAIALRALHRVSHSMALEDQQVDRDFEQRVRTYIDTALRDRDLWETP